MLNDLSRVETSNRNLVLSLVHVFAGHESASIGRRGDSVQATSYLELLGCKLPVKISQHNAAVVADAQQSVPRWDQRHFTRRLAMQAELPGLVLVDGGITQLHAAQAELMSLGLSHLPVAGLAKQYEEIYRGESNIPLRLPRNSEALRILQRLRDEAHRFAITYHRKLRNRRIRESLLDEIPGIGQTRKAALLTHFGSVKRLSKASTADIAAVPGFGKEMAELIHSELARLQKRG